MEVLRCSTCHFLGFLLSLPCVIRELIVDSQFLLFGQEDELPGRGDTKWDREGMMWFSAHCDAPLYSWED